MFRNNKTLRKKIGEIILLNRIILLIAVLVYILFIGSVSAYERPEFKDGLARSWHPGKICIPCHYTLAPEKARVISGNCASCHINTPKDAPNSKKIDMNKILKMHTEIICIRCHVGSKSRNDVTAMDFHRVMSKTACLACHKYENGTYIKPLKKNCSDCHSYDPHVVHDKKLEKLCVACHGEFGEQYVNKSIGSQDKISSPAGLTISIKDIGKMEINKSEYTTIGQFIMNLIEQFSQILR